MDIKQSIELATTDKPGVWKLACEFKFEHKKQEYTISEGFITDLASVPRILWAIFPPFGTYTNAAIIHDYCYQQGSALMSRKEADLLFYENMIKSGVHKFKAWLMYKAVRVFGSSRFK